MRKSLTIKFGEHMSRGNFVAVFAGANGCFFGHEFDLIAVDIVRWEWRLEGSNATRNDA